MYTLSTYLQDTTVCIFTSKCGCKSRQSYDPDAHHKAISLNSGALNFADLLLCTKILFANTDTPIRCG